MHHAWNWDPLIIVTLGITAALYVEGLRHLWQRTIRPWEAVAYLFGWLTLVVALLSPIDAMSDVLFSIHMTQHELLMLVAAPLLVIGRPLLAFIWALPPESRMRIGEWTQRRHVRAAWNRLTGPVTVLVLHGAAIWISHIPLLFEAALKHEWAHAIQHLAYFLTAALFWWSLLHGRYGRIGYGVAIVFVFVTAMHTGLLGALMIFTRRTWYSSYPNLADQQLAGLIMWIPGGVIFMLIGLSLLVAWLGEAERRVAFSRLPVLLLVLLVPMDAVAGRAYITNERDGSVTVIDTSLDKVVETIPLGSRARGIELGPDGRRLFVALSIREGKGRDAIAEIDVATRKVISHHKVGTDPEELAVGKDGTRIFVANEDAGTASIVDVKERRILETVVVGIEPEGVSISPDGRWVYVTAETSNTVSVIDTRRNEVVANFMVGARPRAAAFTPDGSHAFVTGENGRSLSIVDARRHVVIKTLELHQGAKPMGVVVSPDGKRIFVSTGRGNSVVVIDRATTRVVATIPVEGRPWGIAITPDGRKLYTANGLTDDVAVIDTQSLRVLRRIKAGDGPWGVAIGPR